MLTADLAFLSWGVLAVACVIEASIGWYLVRAGRRRGWSATQCGVLAAGALASWATLAFTSPPPDGVALAGKLAQNLTFALVVAALAWMVVARRTRSVT